MRSILTAAPTLVSVDHPCGYVRRAWSLSARLAYIHGSVADVVKTRLQAERRAGQTHYRGLFHALVTIPREEGVRALFKGWSARVIVSLFLIALSFRR
jgi:hypothetical protein